MRLFNQPQRSTEPPLFGKTKSSDRALDWYGWGAFRSTPTAIHYLSARSPRYHGEAVLPSDRVRGKILRAFITEPNTDPPDILAAERRTVDRALLQKFLALDSQPTHIISFWYEFLRDDRKSRKILLQTAINLEVPGHSNKALAQKSCEFLARIAREEKIIEGSSGTTIAPPLLMRCTPETAIYWITAIYRYYRSYALFD